MGSETVLKKVHSRTASALRGTGSRSMTNKIRMGERMNEMTTRIETKTVGELVEVSKRNPNYKE